MAVTLKTQNQILGAAIVEILGGELSDETIAAIDGLNRDDLPDPLNNLVGYIQAMSTMPELRQSIVTSLINEIRVAALERLEERREHPNPISTSWMTMYHLLTQLLEGGDYDIRLNAEMMPDPEQVPAWAEKLTKHVQGTSTEGKELTLSLLDVLENMIKQRREQLA